MSFNHGSGASRANRNALLRVSAQYVFIVLAFYFANLLAGLLQPSETGLVLTVIAISEVLAILIASIDGACTRKENRRHAARKLGLILNTLLGISCMAAVLAFFPMPLLATTPFAVFVMLFSSLIVALTLSTILTRDHGTGAIVFGAIGLRVALSFGFVLGASAYWHLDFVSILGLHLLAAALCWAFALLWCGRRGNEHGSTWKRAYIYKVDNWELGIVLVRYIDVLLVGWLLSSSEALVYFLARLFGLAVDCPIRAFTSRMKIAIGNNLDFGLSNAANSHAARINLGVLLVGGSSAIIIMLIASKATEHMEFRNHEFMQVLVWIVGASCVPAVCGATDIFLSDSRYSSARKFLAWTSLCATVGVFLLLDVTSAVALAQLHFALNAAFGLVSAIFVAMRVGILPGLTALLYKQIRII